jgi:hypothetical protein
MGVPRKCFPVKSTRGFFFAFYHYWNDLLWRVGTVVKASTTSKEKHHTLYFYTTQRHDFTTVRWQRFWVGSCLSDQMNQLPFPRDLEVPPWLFPRELYERQYPFFASACKNESLMTQDEKRLQKLNILDFKVFVTNSDTYWATNLAPMCRYKKSIFPNSIPTMTALFIYLDLPCPNRWIVHS